MTELSSLPPLSPQSKLKKLNLVYDNIKSLPDNLFHYQLEEIHLSSNSGWRIRLLPFSILTFSYNDDINYEDNDDDVDNYDDDDKDDGDDDDDGDNGNNVNDNGFDDIITDVVLYPQNCPICHLLHSRLN